MQRCLPSLAVLDECGIDFFTASFRVVEGSVWDGWLDRPYFLAVTALPCQYRAAATEAISQVLHVLREAIDDWFHDHDGIDGCDSALMYATVSQGRAAVWGVHCEVVALIEDDRPDLALRLR